MITTWGWGVKTGYFYLGTCILGIIYTYFRLPETQHRSFGELDTLFHNRVPARKFKTTLVDQFHEDGVVVDDKADFEGKGAADHVEKV